MRWMVQQLKVPTANTGDPCSIPKTYMVEIENQFLQIVIWLSHVCHGTRAPAHKHIHAHTHTINQICFNLFLYMVFLKIASWKD